MMQSPSARIDWLSIGQLGVGVLSCLICLLLTGGLILLANNPYLLGKNSGVETQGLLMLAGLLTAVGLLNLPSIVFSWRSLNNRPPASPSRTNPFRLASMALISLPVWLLGGQWLTQTSLAASLLPIINVLALLIPIWWLVEFGRRKLPNGSPQRNWGLISASVGLTPVIIILVETFIAILVVIGVLAWLGREPGWMAKFNQLFIQFSQSEFNSDFLTSLFKDLLGNPLVITTVFLVLGFLMPLIEELLKPLALWTLRKRMVTPAEGFSGGLILGAGFAFIESASLIAQMGSGSEWSQTVILRITTSLLHMTTSALAGWGLASAWTQKKRGRAVLAILAATGLHGLWNSLVVSVALIPLLNSLGDQSPLLNIFSGFSTYAFITILTFLAGLLVLMNHLLYKDIERNTTISES
jgi:hypothetical protein